MPDSSSIEAVDPRSARQVLTGVLTLPPLVLVSVILVASSRGDLSVGIAAVAFISSFVLGVGLAFLRPAPIPPRGVVSVSRTEIALVALVVGVWFAGVRGPALAAVLAVLTVYIGYACGSGMVYIRRLSR